VESKEATQLQVLEVTRQLPRFSMFRVMQEAVGNISSYVKMPIEERPSRVSTKITFSVNLSGQCYLTVLLSMLGFGFKIKKLG